MQKKIGFIGTGQMATSLASGFLKNQTVRPEQLFGYDLLQEASSRFAKITSGKAVKTIDELVQVSEVVVLSVKPQQMHEVLHVLASIRSHSHNEFNRLWISIAPGIPITSYLKELGTTARLVRVMPNTPCNVGEGVCGFCVSESATEDDVALAQNLLSTVGIAIRFPERQLDAVAGLSGSGPAYVYMMIEAMADGGVKMGLSRELALKLAAQTVFGAAKMVIQTGEHPAVLKDRVCSPRGTTISGVAVLEKAGFRHAVINAVENATLRSKELANE
ncbi:MAG: pyrroline-5-carboxylate reductase [Planctomycetaceae bacterium]|jgi:pyrroline-5-carboxylate reductase|nr:pyrroline-5-carboxylate reductase [Planctomycetaceae bacterium]